jgi:hypothetical protein
VYEFENGKLAIFVWHSMGEMEKTEAGEHFRY